MNYSTFQEDIDQIGILSNVALAYEVIGTAGNIANVGVT